LKILVHRTAISGRSLVFRGDGVRGFQANSTNQKCSQKKNIVVKTVHSSKCSQSKTHQESREKLTIYHDGPLFLFKLCVSPRVTTPTEQTMPDSITIVVGIQKSCVTQTNGFVLNIRVYYSSSENEKVLCVDNENVQETHFRFQKIFVCSSRRLFYLTGRFYNCVEFQASPSDRQLIIISKIKINLRKIWFFLSFGVKPFQSKYFDLELF